MEYLYGRGYLGVDHRINNRRNFDLIENLLPEEILNAPNPFTTTEEYQDWHVFRRVGSLGLAQTNSNEYWGGILGVKSKERQVSLARLTQQEKVIPLVIDEDPDTILFIRTADLPTLKNAQTQKLPRSGAALIAPLDNLMWNRNMIEIAFRFLLSVGSLQTESPT